MKCCQIGSYEIYGNQYVAIAVNVNNEIDSHYFTIDPDCHNHAYYRACAWVNDNE